MSSTLDVHMAMTGHSLGRNKLEHLLASGAGAKREPGWGHAGAVGVGWQLVGPLESALAPVAYAGCLCWHSPHSSRPPTHPTPKPFDPPPYSDPPPNALDRRDDAG